ncbi:hypothetical protein VKT23_015406 [Stygiomarasmius scandens]|uniref:Secreted protein n=1 Tax=Marasmiellus scandens TaxID=2682957 RepID=A0ABR1J238_9AGAR
MIFIATFFVLIKLYAISFMATLNMRRVVRGKGTDRQGNTASNNNTNIFHLVTRVPSFGPREMEGWETAYTPFLNFSFPTYRPVLAFAEGRITQDHDQSE